MINIPEFASSELSEYLDQEAALLLLVLDEKGTVLKANNYTLNSLGRDIIGKNFSKILVDFTQHTNLQDMLKQNRRPHLLNVNYSSGLPQTYYFRFLPLKDRILAAGELNHLEVESLRSNMMNLHNEFSNLNRELHKKNAELVKLNDLKNQFLGMAAHDLRNPIGAIQNLSEFLLEEAGTSLSQEHLQFINVIHSSSKFMLSLLDQLLDIARIEAGKLELNKKPTDLITLLKSCVDLNKILADKKKIKIRLHHYEAIPLVELDSMKIEQVMNNLLSNAVKFSEADTVVDISVFQSNEHVTVAVKDQGPGIPEKDLDKLFKPFSKTSVRLPSGEKSTGLGLAIVQKIIMGHLGKIWVESKEGEGSTFYFSLPVSHQKRNS